MTPSTIGTLILIAVVIFAEFRGFKRRYPRHVTRSHISVSKTSHRA